MRYSYEFKIKCIEMYERGEYPETPEGVSTEIFKQHIIRWKKMIDLVGVDAFRHKPQNKKWNPEEKLELVTKILAGESYNCVTLSNGINNGILYQWVKNTKKKGTMGLVSQKKGRPRKVPIMKKKTTPKSLT